jgi:hypothetical protein
MGKYLILLLLPLFAGCACTGCFKEDVSKLYSQEKDSFISLNQVIPDFFKDEFRHTGGLKRDVTRQFDRETLDPRVYFDNFHELFCTCH